MCQYAEMSNPLSRHTMLQATGAGLLGLSATVALPGAAAATVPASKRFDLAQPSEVRFRSG